MKGDFIGVREDANVFVLEKRFIVKETGRAILRATALGLYFAEINGMRAGDAFLTPGWTSYNKMLQVQEYDVTPLVKAGENVLSLTVGEGWYKGRITWESKFCLYGEKSAVCAELMVNGATVAETGIDWTDGRAPSAFRVYTTGKRSISPAKERRSRRASSHSIKACSCHRSAGMSAIRSASPSKRSYILQKGNSYTTLVRTSRASQRSERLKVLRGRSSCNLPRSSWMATFTRATCAAQKRRIVLRQRARTRFRPNLPSTASVM